MEYLKRNFKVTNETTADDVFQYYKKEGGYFFTISDLCDYVCNSGLHEIWVDVWDAIRKDIQNNHGTIYR